MRALQSVRNTAHDGSGFFFLIILIASRRALKCIDHFAVGYDWEITGPSGNLVCRPTSLPAFITASSAQPSVIPGARQRFHKIFLVAMISIFTPR